MLRVASTRPLQNTPDDFKERFCDFSEKEAAAKATLDAALAARVSANPIRKQMEIAESCRMRLEKKVANAELAIVAKRDAVASAQAALQEQETILAELKSRLDKAQSDIKALAHRYSCEQSPITSGESGAPHTAADIPAAAPAGYISLAEANQQWAEAMAQVQMESEAKFEKMLIELQSQQQPPDEATASDANDLGSLDDLEFNDDAWSKVERSKRKSVLNRSRDKFARDIHASISGVIKASKKTGTMSSPFKKR